VIVPMMVPTVFSEVFPAYVSEVAVMFVSLSGGAVPHTLHNWEHFLRF
jgi:hypothetical protein